MSLYNEGEGLFNSILISIHGSNSSGCISYFSSILSRASCQLFSVHFILINLRYIGSGIFSIELILSFLNSIMTIDLLSAVSLNVLGIIDPEYLICSNPPTL